LTGMKDDDASVLRMLWNRDLSENWHAEEHLSMPGSLEKIDNILLFSYTIPHFLILFPSALSRSHQFFV
jgi:hypothetical protein